MNQIIYSIGASKPITPAEPLPPLPEIPRGSLLIIEGRAPIWRYGIALHLLHGSSAAAIAFYDPKLGAVVVASHSSQWSVGEVIDMTLQYQNKS
ncbi:MAG: CRISPR-associated ring nuclease Crn3/Csx3 [Methanotrichaceae archaeon]